MKKFVICNVISILSFASILIMCLAYAPVLLADLPTYTQSMPNQITLSIDDYTPSNLTKIRYFDNAIYLADKTGQKVIEHKNGTSKIIHETSSSTDTSKNTEPFDMLAFGDKYLISTTTLFVYYVDSQTPQANKTLSSYKNDDLDGQVYSPQTLAKSADNEIYLLIKDNTKNIILKYRLNDENPTLFCNLTDSTSQNFDNGGFCITEDGETIYFSVDKKIYQLDTATKSVSQLLPDLLDSTISQKIDYLNVDNLDNVYAKAGTSLYKINSTGIIATATLASEIVSIDFDFVHGDIYCITNANEIYSTQLLTNNGDNFITNYSAIQPTVKLATITPSTEVIDAVKVTTATRIYQHKTRLASFKNLVLDKKLIVLEANDPTFYYVFDNNCDSTEGYQLGYVLKTACTALTDEIPTEFSDHNAGKVITGLSKIFCMPISQPVATDTFVASLGMLHYGDVVTILPSPLLNLDSNGASFVAVKYNKNSSELIGYIDSRTLVSCEQVAIETKSVPNAVTKAETIIYGEKNCFNEIDVLAKGSEVKIISNLDDNVSKIEYYIFDNGDEIIKTGYCKTSFLDTGQLTTAQILGVVLVIISVLVTVIVLIVYHHRKKKIHPTLPDATTEEE